ncbi:MAG: response regulator [Magnetococcales bacterium]|nr:response regulator [Magnetococcales bacterium]
MARILLVEDQADIRSMLTLRLELEEHEIETAENGAIGVEKALSNRYDAILMDMHMPVMDGHEAVRVLREKGYAGLIVAVTASASLHDAHRTIEGGCNAYITKPIDDDFEEKIGEILLKHGQSA